MQDTNKPINVKKLLIFMTIFPVLLFSLVFIARSNYDSGYQDGWKGKKKFLVYLVSEEYRRGCDDGIAAADDYLKGCDDSEAGNKANPKYKNNPNYTKGYNEC